MKISLSMSRLLSEEMSKVAAHHSNDLLSNQYARTAKKLEELGAVFSTALSSIDLLTIRVFIWNYLK